MKLSFRLVIVGIAVLPVGLTGCGLDQHPNYPKSLKYPQRRDPIVIGPAAKLGDERYDPDRPGVFPIMSYSDIYKPDNPLFAKSKELNDTILRDPTKISDKDRKELDAALDAAFGSPADPKIDAAATGIDQETLDALKLDDKTIAKGSTRYRVHCIHCHGLPGDGRGPTARWVNPHPRDFRYGIFKFQSVDQATDGRQRPPARADFLRTVRTGLEGTAMPSFALLQDDELEALVSYVMYLSTRGRAHSDVIKAFFNFDAKTGMLEWNAGPDADEPVTMSQAVGLFAKKFVTEGWLESNSPAKAIKVGAYPYKDGDIDELKKSVERGKHLFNGDEKKHPRGKSANCVSCHVDYGRQARFRFDDWATLARPNNFSAGVFRGGRRPVDLYFRIHSGINGSGMTPFGKVLQPDDIWDLINFVSNLPYPAMRERLAMNVD